MKWYHLNWDWTGFPGDHKHCLPLTVCPHCGRRGGVAGASYPHIDPLSASGLPLGLLDSRKLKCVPWQAFSELRLQVQAMFNIKEPMPPGAAIGPLFGRVPRTNEDVFGPDPWCLCIRESAFEKLKAAGVLDLAAAATKMTLPRGSTDELLEVVLPRSFVYSDTCGPSYCQTCQFASIEGEKGIYQRARLSASPSLFRNPAGGVMCSEAFRAAYDGAALRGLRFAAVKVSED